MQQTMSHNELHSAPALRGHLNNLAEMAGETFHSAQGIVGGVLLAFVAMLLLRFHEPIIRALFGSPEAPPEPAPLLFNEDLTPHTAQVLVGRKGTAQAPLRPMGKAEVGGRTYTVKSEGIYIDPGTPVRVDRIEGPHIIVVPVMEEA